INTEFQVVSGEQSIEDALDQFKNK
ncbi:oxidoreductase, partial [Staphylococcus gallinarum]